MGGISLEPTKTRRASISRFSADEFKQTISDSNAGKPIDPNLREVDSASAEEELSSFNIITKNRVSTVQQEENEVQQDGRFIESTPRPKLREKYNNNKHGSQIAGALNSPPYTRLSMPVTRDSDGGLPGFSTVIREGATSSSFNTGVRDNDNASGVVRNAPSGNYGDSFGQAGPIFSPVGGGILGLRVTGKFRVERSPGVFHKGIDLGNQDGLLYSMHSGRVEIVQYEEGGYGQWILINHGSIASVYAHGIVGSQIVKQGQVVSGGQPIMRMGNSGHSYGTHLHFEVIRTGTYPSNQIYTNPEQYLRTGKLGPWYS